MAHRAPYTFLSLKRFRYVLSTLWLIKFWSPLFLHYGLISTYGRRAFSYSITNSNTKSATYIAEHISPNHRTRFSKSPSYFTKQVSPNNRTLFSKSPRYFVDQWAAYVLFCSLWKRPSLRSLPTRATGSALCVMGGRLRFLGHAYPSYTCTGSTFDVMDYRLAKAESSLKN